MKRAIALIALGTYLLAGCGDDSSTTSNQNNDASAGGTSGQGGASGSGAGAICAPGEKVDVEACEKCGVLRRTCDASGHFGDPVCEGQGECTAGETKSEACGPCGIGTRTATCSSQCSWGAWGSCNGEGCVPDSTDQCCIGRGCGCRVCREDCTMGSCQVPCPV